MERSYIPYGTYFSSPFCSWQGSLSREHSMKLAANVAKTALDAKKIPLEELDALFLGITVLQKQSFYGAPWLAGMLGVPHLSGPTFSQACATSARLVAEAALNVEAGYRKAILAIGCDRTSNGPHVYYPDPKGTGGMGTHENPVWDNFNKDPWAKNAMVQTAENVAKEAGITREEQDDVTLIRYAQYADGMADDRAFQKRYMVSATVGSKRKQKTIEADEGIFPTTKEGLEKLRPVLPEGTITFGTQTHPADGNAGLLVTDEETAKRLAPGGPTVRIQSFGETRVKKGFMPMAVVPAAQDALDRAGLKVSDLAAIKTHNPFAVNDVYFSHEMNVSPDKVNNYGSPLVYGHPQAPTGIRAIIELIEELVIRGGGHGLFTGCAAGDTAMAVTVKVG